MVNTRDQPLIVVVPVLVMVMFAVSPVFHALITSDTRHATGVLEAGGDDGGADEGEALAVGDWPDPPETRYITTPWPSTVALMMPVVLVLVAPLHRSLSV